MLGSEEIIAENRGGVLQEACEDYMIRGQNRSIVGIMQSEDNTLLL